MPSALTIYPNKENQLSIRATQYFFKNNLITKKKLHVKLKQVNVMLNFCEDPSLPAYKVYISRELKTHPSF